MTTLMMWSCNNKYEDYSSLENNHLLFSTFEPMKISFVELLSHFEGQDMYYLNLRIFANITQEQFYEYIYSDEIMTNANAFECLYITVVSSDSISIPTGTYESIRSGNIQVNHLWKETAHYCEPGTRVDTLMKYVHIEPLMSYNYHIQGKMEVENNDGNYSISFIGYNYTGEMFMFNYVGEIEHKKGKKWRE